MFPEDPLDTEITPNYGRTDPVEPDWYADKGDRKSIFGDNYSETSVSDDKISRFSHSYNVLKVKTYWYLWKSHTKQYGSYDEFNKYLGKKPSISKELKKDLKLIFKKR